MPSVAMIGELLDVGAVFALLIGGTIFVNVEDHRHRKTLTRKQLEDQLEEDRREMDIW
ncbi:hypothetical protein [Bradyrhizobium cenepequi]|uniref:hypothetical protein n=1 Tax=Bradyrhizobium cenepequi TaxID=2821403 RepID=UPI001CE2AAFC|nr:hypothetical protein [Bradyrhizobium cenepequi]MCA6112902.1 hypothetical protein [Bradyrhizobium cenepequi]